MSPEVFRVRPTRSIKIMTLIVAQHPCPTYISMLMSKVGYNVPKSGPTKTCNCISIYGNKIGLLLVVTVCI